MLYNLPHQTFVIVKREKFVLLRSDEIKKNDLLYTEDGWKNVYNFKYIDSTFLYKYISNIGILYSFERYDNIQPFLFYINDQTYSLLENFYKIDECFKKKIDNYYTQEGMLIESASTSLKIIFKTSLSLGSGFIYSCLVELIRKYGYVDGGFIINGLDQELSSIVSISFSFFGIPTTCKDSKLIVDNCSLDVLNGFEYRASALNFVGKQVYGVEIEIDSNGLWNNGFKI